MRKPLHVLLVEDSSNDVDLFSLALERGSVQIELNVVSDGDEATSYLRQENHYHDALLPDLILLDLNLPRKTGNEVLDEIKQDRHLKAIPVIVLSTSSAPIDIVSCYNLGAAAYLIKPDELTDLIKLIQKLSDFWSLAEFSPASRWREGCRRHSRPSDALVCNQRAESNSWVTKRHACASCSGIFGRSIAVTGGLQLFCLSVGDKRKLAIYYTIG
jgi:chemotaxis family two-component system response regulator Rcp1